jgi:hypothetical protein
MTPLWQQPAIVRQTQLILNSYHHWLGRELIERSGNEVEEAQRLFETELSSLRMARRKIRC